MLYLIREDMFRGGSRVAATSKMECFVVIVKGFQPSAVITKRSILDVAAALDTPLKTYDKHQIQRGGLLFHQHLQLSVLYIVCVSYVLYSLRAFLDQIRLKGGRRRFAKKRTKTNRGRGVNAHTNVCSKRIYNEQKFLPIMKSLILSQEKLCR